MERIIRRKKVEMSPRLLARVRAADSPQKVQELAKQNGIELTIQQAAALFYHVKPKG